MSKEVIGDCTIYNGDCLEIMPTLESASIDLVLTDPPFGTTSCSWDSVIPFNEMWDNINRIVKDNTPVCLFGSEPFSSQLRCSNLKNYKYDWIWDKKIPSGMCNAKIQPMRRNENISVFINGKSFYYPIMEKRKEPIKSGGMKNSASGGTMGKTMKPINKIYTEKYPTNILVFDKIRNGSVHPTQKPTDLLEYLIKTYTNEGDLVLDFTSGSFSTAIACLNTKRKFIGIELDTNYYEIGKKRITEWYENQKSIFD